MTKIYKSTKYTHKKSLKIVTVVGVGKIQSDVNLKDMDEVVIYRDEDGSLWARRWKEFSDGRFELIVDET